MLLAEVVQLTEGLLRLEAVITFQRESPQFAQWVRGANNDDIGFVMENVNKE
jgi:hypothetical protein